MTLSFAAGFPVIDATGRTSAFGVWAAGSAVDPRAQVIASAGAGKAAIAINADLVQEDVECAVDDHHADDGVFSAALEAGLTHLVLGDRRHGFRSATAAPGHRPTNQGARHVHRPTRTDSGPSAVEAPALTIWLAVLRR